MSKNAFLQSISYLAAGIIVGTLYLNHRSYGRYSPGALWFDSDCLLSSVIYSVILNALLYVVVKHDIYIVPGILPKLDQIKHLILELSTIEKMYISVLAGVSAQMNQYLLSVRVALRCSHSKVHGILKRMRVYWRLFAPTGIFVQICRLRQRRQRLRRPPPVRAESGVDGPWTAIVGLRQERPDCRLL